MKSFNRTFVLIVIVGVSFTFSGCDFIDSIKEKFTGSESTPVSQPSPQKNVKDDAPLAADEVLKVADWRMTIDEFNDRLVALKEVLPDFDENDLESKKMVLDELIRQQLVVKNAEDTGLANDPDIRDAVDEFRRTLIVRQAASKITENIEVTDEEIVNFYEENKDVLIEPIEMKVRTIVMDSQLAANELLVQIIQGANFAEMAKQNSIADNAAQGGDLGWIAEVPFPEMANALIPLEKGDVSSVFRGPDGFYIAKVEDKRGGEQIPLEEVKEDIRQNRIAFKQQQAIVNHIEQLKTKYNIETNEELLSQ